MLKVRTVHAGPLLVQSLGALEGPFNAVHDRAFEGVRRPIIVAEVLDGCTVVAWTPFRRRLVAVFAEPRPIAGSPTGGLTVRCSTAACSGARGVL